VKGRTEVVNLLPAFSNCSASSRRRFTRPTSAELLEERTGNLPLRRG